MNTDSTGRHVAQIERQQEQAAIQIADMRELLATIRVTVERMDQRQEEFLSRLTAAESEINALRVERMTCQSECYRAMSAYQDRLDARLSAIEPVAKSTMRVVAWLGALVIAVAAAALQLWWGREG